MNQPQSLNGVDIGRLQETMQAIRDEPALARCRFRAVNRWQGGGHNCTTIQDYDGACQTLNHDQGFMLNVDEPPLLLGQDLGPNPVEYLLNALSGCLTSSLVYHAAARGIMLESVESHLEGELDLRGFLGMSNQVRNGYENIRVTFRIKADVPQETLDQLVELAKARSPVFDMITHPVPVAVSAEKIPASLH